MFTALMKTFTACVLIIFSFAVIADAQVCQPAPVGLVSWWSGDGNALDSRSRNNGTLQNGATFGAGQAGQAFSFDGVDDFVNVPDSPSFDFATNEITVDAWIMPTADPTLEIRGIIDQFSNVDATFFLALGPADASGSRQGRFIVYGDSTGFVYKGIITVARLQPNVFTHVAVTYKQSTQEIKFYINGVEAATTAEPGSVNITAIFNSALPVRIGRNHATALSPFAGLIDEPSVYDRALSDAEITTIHAAGTAGKCKPTATVAPSGQVGWWGGDGNPNDISGNNNNGTLQNGAGFAVGKVGQGFSLDGIDDAVGIPDSPSMSVSNAITIEAWVRPDVLRTQVIFSKYNSPANENSWYLAQLSDGNIQFLVSGGGAGDTIFISAITSASALPTTSFTHVAGTFDVATNDIRIYINGTQAAATIIGAGTVPFIDDNATPVNIGRAENSASGPLFFDGLINEVSLYNRALTDAEITSIFNAGLAGKLKTANTPVGFASVGAKSQLQNIKSAKISDPGYGTRDFERAWSPLPSAGEILAPEAVNLNIGDATITFPTVTTAGMTQQIPLVSSLFPALPMGIHTGLIYDIATSAVFTGSPNVCFNLPSFGSAAVFANLRIMHLESGVWQNRTTTTDFATRTLCSQVPSLSPFAIANFAPTAANASISGRVLTQTGYAPGVTVTVSGGNLPQPRTILTSSFGRYSFADLSVGHPYIITVASKKYHFNDPTRMIVLTDNVTGVDFIADSP